MPGILSTVYRLTLNECSLYSLVDQQATSINSTVHHVILQKIEASTYERSTTAQVFNYERRIHLPVCTEIVGFSCFYYLSLCFICI